MWRRDKGLQKEMTKTAERWACREEGMQRGGHAESWRNRRGCKGEGEMETDDLLW